MTLFRRVLPTGGGYVTDNIQSVPRALSDLRDSSQRIIDAATWGIPILAVLDLARLLVEDGGFRWEWMGYLVVTAIAVQQRRTRNPDLTVMLSVGWVWIAIVSLLRATGVLDAPRDLTAGLVALVVIALILVAMTRFEPVRIALIVGAALVAWTIAIGVVEAVPVSTWAFRAAVVTASFGAASWMVIDVRSEIRRGRRAAGRRTRLHAALAECARNLLEGGGDQHLEQALEALLDATAATTVFLERNVEHPERGFCSSMIWERGEAYAPEDNPWTLVRWVDRPLAHASLSIGKPFVFVLEDITGVEREPYEGLQNYAEANYPVISDGRWVGQVGFSYKGRPVEDEYHVLGAVAEMVGAFWKHEAERERLERSVANRASLLSAVSHELRTPLTAVVGLSSELASSLALPLHEQRSIARIIEEQASDMTAIVEDLLVAGRADGQVAVVPIDVSVYEVITGVLKTFNESGFVVGGDQISVKADPSRLRQILRNLIGNAAKYGGESRSILSGTLGGRGFIDVIDDGAGVDVMHVERIFDPYERAHPIELHPGSVGLGLAVSRRLARLMGGDVEYRREGGRTVFRLTLPLTDSTTS